MKVLITGGLGYVGGRLAQHLVASGSHVVLGTRKASASPTWCLEARVVRMLWESDNSLREACASVDAVVHLAGMNAQECSADPVAALMINGVATARLASAAASCGVGRFIHVSTAHVYGSPLAGTISEENCANALHPYATSHRAGEDAVLWAGIGGRIETLVARLSNSFGPPAHAGANCWMLLVNDLCNQAMTQGRMVLRTSGLQRRNFVTLKDVCRAMEHMLQMPYQRAQAGIYNVGGEWSPSVLEMAQRIARCCRDGFGFVPEIARTALGRPEEVASLDFRIDRLRAASFKPEDDVDAEISATLEFCRAHPGQSPGTP